MKNYEPIWVTANRLLNEELESVQVELVEEVTEFTPKQSLLSRIVKGKTQLYYHPESKSYFGTIKGKKIQKPMKEAQFLQHLIHDHKQPHQVAAGWVKQLKAPHEKHEKDQSNTGQISQAQKHIALAKHTSKVASDMGAQIKKHLDSAKTAKKHVRNMTHIKVKGVDISRREYFKGKDWIKDKHYKKATAERVKQYRAIAKKHMSRAKALGYDPKTWKE